MASAAYTIKLIESKQIALQQIEKAPNTYMPISELYRLLEQTKDSCPSLISFIIENCLADTYSGSQPCFKIALNRKDKPSIYLVEKGLTTFLNNYELQLTQMGIKKSILKKVYKQYEVKRQTDSTFPLHHILYNISRTYGTPKYSELPRKTLEKMRNDLVPTDKGTLRPLFFYTTISGKLYLSVQRKDIPLFFERWGKQLGFSDQLIQSTQNTQNLPDLDDSLLPITHFALATKSSELLSNWLSANINSLFSHEFNGENPALLTARTNEMAKIVCFNKKEIPNFVKRNINMLILHGLNAESAKQIIAGTLTANNINKSPKGKQNPSVQTATIRIDALTQHLKKATAFIPELKSFIQENCLDDKFEMTLPDQSKIISPIFTSFQSWGKQKTIHIYKEAIADFVEKRFFDLLKLDISYDRLIEILNQNNKPVLQNNQLIPLKHFYAYLGLSMDYNSFEKSALKQKDLMIKTLNSHQKEVEIPALIETTSLMYPFKINTLAAQDLMNNLQKELHITPLMQKRFFLVLSQQTSIEVKTKKDIRELLGIDQKQSVKLNQLLNQKLNEVYQVVDKCGKKTLIPCYGVYNDRRNGLALGIYQNAVPAFVHLNKTQLLNIGADKHIVEQIEDKTATIFSLEDISVQPIAKKTLLPQTKEQRQKE